MFKTIARVLVFLSIFTLNEQYAQLFYLGAFLFTPKKIFTAGLLALAALKAALRPRRMPRNGKNLAVLAFGLAGIPSLAMSYLMGTSMREVVIGATSFYAVILLYFLIVYMVEDARDLDVAIWAAVLGAALVGFSALTGIGAVQEGVWTRAGGLGRNPNLAATYSVTGLTMGFLLFLEKPRAGARRAVLLALMALALMGVLSSLSRTGFLCLVAVSGFLMVRAGRLDLLRFGLPVLLLVGIAFFFLAPEQYFERIATTGEQAQALAQADLKNRRILGWWEGIKAFAASPIVGVGRLTLPEWIARHSPKVGAITPHSSYIHVLATMGLSGFLPWIIAAALNWRDFSRVQRWARRFRARRDPELSALAIRALFMQGAFLVWLVASFFSPFADDEGLWLLLGLGTVVAHQARERALALLEEDARLDALEPGYGFGVPVGAR
jgi:O-antigen ligase